MHGLSYPSDLEAPSRVQEPGSSLLRPACLGWYGGSIAE